MPYQNTKYDELFNNNQGLVYYKCREMHLLNNEDAVNTGLFGLYKAAKTFDESKGINFSTYALQVIFNEIGMYFRKENKHRGVISYNDIMEDTKEKTLEYFDTLGSDGDIEGGMLCEDIFKEIKELYKNLNNNSAKKVIKAWAESGFDITQYDITDKTGVQQASVSRILSAFKTQLRNRLERKGMM